MFISNGRTETVFILVYSTAYRSAGTVHESRQQFVLRLDFSSDHDRSMTPSFQPDRYTSEIGQERAHDT